MPLQGMILNRTHHVSAPELTADEALAGAAALDQSHESPATADALRIHAALYRQVEREVAVATTFTAAHPRVPVIAIAAQPADVHDIDGLREIGVALAGTTRPKRDDRPEEAD
jgi:hypothetical protein